MYVHTIHGEVPIFSYKELNFYIGLQIHHLRDLPHKYTKRYMFDCVWYINSLYCIDFPFIGKSSHLTTLIESSLQCRMN